jgi:hypothetical protein
MAKEILRDPGFRNEMHHLIRSAVRRALADLPMAEALLRDPHIRTEMRRRIRTAVCDAFTHHPGAQ